MSYDAREYRQEFYKVLAEAVGEEKAWKITTALEEWIESEKDDLRDKIDGRGLYDPDY